MADNVIAEAVKKEEKGAEAPNPLEAKIKTLEAELEKKSAALKELIDQRKTLKLSAREARERLEALEKAKPANSDELQKEIDSLKTFKQGIEKKNQARLEAMVKNIPDGKKGLFPKHLMDAMGTEKAIEYLEQNAGEFFGKQADPAVFSALPTFNPPASKITENITLTSEEKAAIVGILSEENAIRLKQANPNYFKEKGFLKK